jgi:hypothetical protein
MLGLSGQLHHVSPPWHVICEEQTEGTKTAQAVVGLLNYAETHPDT